MTPESLPVAILPATPNRDLGRGRGSTANALTWPVIC
jgi:hypothetical protein